MRQNPNVVDEQAARRMIKAHLYQRPQEEAVNEEEDPWKGESNQTVKKSQKIEQKNDMDLEDEGDSDDEEEEKQNTKQNKKGKKLHKGSLMPSGTHISWKEEIEKMLK